MEVILLENIRNLGRFGHKVKVAKGYGRNFLIPQGKAVHATPDQLAHFEAERSNLEAKANEKLGQAQKRAEQIEAAQVKITAKAADEGKLYGSVGTLEISKAFKDQGIQLERQEIRLPEGPIREIGTFEVECQLHAEVLSVAKITIVAEES